MDTVSSELIQLKGVLFRFAVGLFLILVGMLTFSFGDCSLFGLNVVCPSMSGPSLATKLFLASQEFLVPEGIPVVALGPVSVFLAPLSFAFMTAFVIAFPYGVIQMMFFLRPALRPNERRLITYTLLPSLLLFYLGAALAYFVIIPKTFSILYSFASPMNIMPMFALDDFLGTTVFITLATGIVFLLPVAMVILSRIGIVPAAFWLSRWRGAFLIVLLFSAVITPDGSGITMIFLAVPLMLLYGSGAIIARVKEGKLV